MEYAKTKDILHVMQMLGHKNIQNTLLYTQLISFQSDEYYSTTAKTVQDAQKLIEAGCEYFCEFDDVKSLRNANRPYINRVLDYRGGSAGI
ncbi:MAG TPA: hypothetical protein VK209_10365 [Candidatus Sulfotelmatobacter sp.]|nr:hypothetical protein [Candidatus Sulfotelmatobacter sp.]